MRQPFFLPLFGCFLLFNAVAHGGTIELALERMLPGLDPQYEVPVIVKAKGKARLDTIRDREKRVRRSKILKALKASAESQQEIRAFLKSQNIKKTSLLWIINGIALHANADVIRKLAALPQVESIVFDAAINAPVPVYGGPAPPEWNVGAIGAPQLWSLGYMGTGVVVANMDTGVDLAHPDLYSRWRGGTNSWFDPNGEHAVPVDRHGHGTQTMGVIIGGDAGGTSIGVAPGARWVAVKIFNDAQVASYSNIHKGYQWLLDPDGDPATDDSADIVNNSWGLQDPNHGCITEFQTDIEVLKAARIAVTFAAGNNGPAPGTANSPANNRAAISVGAVDSDNAIASFSSRGPSACGGTFPAVVAPGVNILTSDLSFGLPGGYATVSGTSIAVSHLSGALALLIDAFPSRDISVVEKAVLDSAQDLGIPGADNNYGSGMIDVLNAYRYLQRSDYIGVYRGGQWYLDKDGTGGWNFDSDSTATFGIHVDTPVAGNWGGSGNTRIGVFRSGAWFLDLNGNGAWDDDVDAAYSFGIPSDIPITGKWTGGASTKIGVFREGAWYLDMNGNGAWDESDGTYSFGIPGDIPVTGDWDGSGTTKIGVVRDNAWFLDMNGNGSWDGGIDAVYSFGIPEDVPVTGDWNGSGTTKIGVVRGGSHWYLDTNGNGGWDEGSDRLVSGFGIAGDVPVTGKW